MAKTSIAEALRKRAEDTRIAAEALGDEDILPTAEQRPTELNIALDKLVSFHTAEIGFLPYDAASLKSLAESIRDDGLLVPIIVRPDIEEGFYEILAGHNRVEACRQHLDVETIRALIYYVDDDAAVAIAVNTNIKQRQKLRPSERALAYRALMNVKKHQGKVIEDTAWTDPETSEPRKTRDMVAAIFEVDRNSVQRYIRLSYLVKPLLQLVDDKTLSVYAGVQLSYYPEEIQNWLAEELQTAPAMTVEEMHRIRKTCPESTATIESFRAAWENAGQDTDTVAEQNAAPVEAESDTGTDAATVQTPPDGAAFNDADGMPPWDATGSDFTDGDNIPTGSAAITPPTNAGGFETGYPNPGSDSTFDSNEGADKQATAPIPPLEAGDPDDDGFDDGSEADDETTDEALALLARKIVKHANAFANHQTPDNFSKLFDAVNEAAEYQEWAGGRLGNVET